MDDLIETMTSALHRFSTGRVVQPVRPTIPIAEDSFFATMPAFVRATDGALTAETGDTGSDLSDQVRPAGLGGPGCEISDGFRRKRRAGIALSSRLDSAAGPANRRAAGAAGRPLHHRGAHGGGVGGLVAPVGEKNRGSRSRSSAPASRRSSHLDALSRVHQLRQVTVWSPNKVHREAFVKAAISAMKQRSGSDLGQTLDSVLEQGRHGQQCGPRRRGGRRRGHHRPRRPHRRRRCSRTAG